MDASLIQTRLEDMINPMVKKGIRMPGAEAVIRANEVPFVFLRYASDGGQRYADKLQTFVGDTMEESIQKAWMWIDAQPSAEDLQRMEFMTKLADTIETGKRYGMDVQFINPLTEAMKRLSENAITHQVDEAGQG